jgi:hypothetical protein
MSDSTVMESFIRSYSYFRRHFSLVRYSRKMEQIDYLYVILQTSGELYLKERITNCNLNSLSRVGISVKISLNNTANSVTQDMSELLVNELIGYI